MGSQYKIPESAKGRAAVVHKSVGMWPEDRNILVEAGLKLEHQLGCKFEYFSFYDEQYKIFCPLEDSICTNQFREFESFLQKYGMI